METKQPLTSSLALNRILVPVDFSGFSSKAVRYAVRFAEQFGATLYLLYVLERSSFITGTDGVVITLPEGQMMNTTKTKLAAFAAEEIKEPVPVHTEVRIGRPYEEVINLAREMQVDLIIIATHGYTGLKHVFLGSTAELVVRHAPCPVLVVREKEHEFIAE
ncbi:universal stress protein [Pedosphaera parvula]|uniref:Universal stress protein n=1 Tax=Pedosphaera parvula (strain Ellin514) TaxID=320771 RepID=B9XC00_PEDPL|nr:universal stress protein [Pedosphaera parvula]EEF62468.1 UspA domain protein [Pedosphaera parvula Ellin514]